LGQESDRREAHQLQCRDAEFKIHHLTTRKQNNLDLSFRFVMSNTPYVVSLLLSRKSTNSKHKHVRDGERLSNCQCAEAFIVHLDLGQSPKTGDDAHVLSGSARILRIYMWVLEDEVGVDRESIEFLPCL
jgi:hypothetical protein